MRKSHNLLSHTEISKICKSKGGVAQARVRAPFNSQSYMRARVRPKVILIARILHSQPDHHSTVELDK